MRSTLKAVAGLFLILLTSACFVETEATLADPDAKALDTRLVGTWYAAEKAEVTLFSIAADEKELGVYAVVFASIRPGAENAVEFAHYRVWRTVVNGRAYLNARRIGAGKDMPTQTVVAYDLTDTTLVLRFIDAKAAIAAIEAGKLKGRVKKGSYVDEVTITSPRAELAAFVGAEGDKLFSQKTGALRKLPPSAN